jgi:integrase/recombinase XerD
MKVSKAVKFWLHYHRTHSKKNTVRAYQFVMDKFCENFGDTIINDLCADDILSFLNQVTTGRKPQTKRIRFSHLTAFFNFIKNNIDSNIKNPCDSPMLKKLFRPKVSIHWDIIEKETVDEIIFRTTTIRNRLILELMARGGMRIGEVLKLTPCDIAERKILLKDPKSGREQEMIFIPQKVAARLNDYIQCQNIGRHERIFPICYEAGRRIVKKAGDLVGINLRPHDLRRHAATYASRCGVPIEIVSKVILRHSNLSTTQMYLGKISDAEAMKCIENLYS